MTTINYTDTERSEHQRQILAAQADLARAINTPEPVSLPGYDLPATPEPVAKLITELHQRAEAVTAARSAVADAETKVKVERDADIAAGAAAIRQGKAAPAPKALDAAAATLDARKRDLAQQQAAQSSAWQELRGALGTHGEAWRTELARQREACTERMSELVDAIADEAETRRQLDAAKNWSEDAHWRPGSPMHAAITAPLRQWITPTESIFTGSH